MSHTEKPSRPFGRPAACAAPELAYASRSRVCQMPRRLWGNGTAQWGSAAPASLKLYLPRMRCMTVRHVAALLQRDPQSRFANSGSGPTICLSQQRISTLWRSCHALVFELEGPEVGHSRALKVAKVAHVPSRAPACSHPTRPVHPIGPVSGLTRQVGFNHPSSLQRRSFSRAGGNRRHSTHPCS